jgi:hypothetical protein
MRVLRYLLLYHPLFILCLNGAATTVHDVNSWWSFVDCIRFCVVIPVFVCAFCHTLLRLSVLVVLVSVLYCAKKPQVRTSGKFVAQGYHALPNSRPVLGLTVVLW